MERRILNCLVRAAGRTVTREELSQHLRQRPHAKPERAIDMHVSHLRKKLAGNAGVAIRAVRGAGYLMEIDPGPVG
ncbi:MAG: winged helix-turn-helix domain-containing protein [Bryobacteraceae bacterium]|nr:winged helix-turn-helix domain-containing protein [Bryobacteraceae bacterium]